MPLVVRLEGTNVERGKEILAKSGLNIIAADGHGRRRARRSSSAAKGAERMSILVDKDTRSSPRASPARPACSTPRRAASTARRWSAGVTPGQGRQRLRRPPGLRHRRARPCSKTGANASVIFVPPPFAADAIMEAVDAGIELVVCITEGIPVARHGQRASSFMAGKKTRLDRPELPGRHHPRRVQDRHHARLHPQAGQRSASSPAAARSPTRRSGSSPRWASARSTCVGIGGDPVNGPNFIDVLTLFKDDPETEGVIMIGEIGGTAEEQRGRRTSSST